MGAIAMAEHDVFHHRSKHINLRYHFVREKIAEGEVILAYCQTADMVADIFTKPLAPIKIAGFVDRLLGQF